ncbi:hypothetical protein OGAPHI_001012 [Ogataea philodendri]|uniref:Uncharacterized protein n=1 Tax=Ogataea philodendri TaxID=1378263 RepID=A0A9P8PFU8_9ASCO|nr:uncharacterized protein OGAPHI_001012 [Ogataea philodendri]KAH3670497.1 hypothetical protein OGAPHI_001012 [Ogataea philodendri]
MSALDDETCFDSGRSKIPSRTRVLSTEQSVAKYQNGDVFLFQKSGHRTMPYVLNGSEAKMDSSSDLISNVSLSSNRTFW